MCIQLIKNAKGGSTKEPKGKKVSLEIRLLSFMLLKELMLATIGVETQTNKSPIKKQSSKSRRGFEIQMMEEEEPDFKQKSPQHEEPQPKPKKRKRAKSGDMQRRATQILIKAGDIRKIRLRTVQTKLTKFADNISRRKGKANGVVQGQERHLFCEENEREIFQFLQNVLRTDPRLRVVAIEILNVLIDNSSRQQIVSNQEDYFELVHFMLELPDCQKECRQFTETMKAFKSVIWLLKEDSLTHHFPFIMNFIQDFISSP